MYGEWHPTVTMVVSMHVVSLPGVIQHGTCKSGLWADVQVLQGDEAMPTHVEG